MAPVRGDSDDFTRWVALGGVDVLWWMPQLWGLWGMQEAVEDTVRYKVGESPPIPQAKVPSWFWPAF